MAVQSHCHSESIKWITYQRKKWREGEGKRFKYSKITSAKPVEGGGGAWKGCY